METELWYLYCSLILSLILAPYLTNTLILNNSKSYKYCHFFALCFVLSSIVLDQGFLTVVWPLFNLFGLYIYAKNNFKNLINFTTLAIFIPFAFSLIASVWLVAGTNNLYLLGYDIYWSLYAALHGNFLGWIFLGCVAYLSTKEKKLAKLYSLACYISFILFLLIAFGIDGVPYIKAIGVIGLTTLVPAVIALYTFNCGYKTSKYLGGLSLLFVLLSMAFAVVNEFWVISPQYFLGARSMVTIHGIMNAFLVTPLFFIAIKIDKSLNN